MYTRIDHKSPAIPALFEQMRMGVVSFCYLANSIEVEMQGQCWVDLGGDVVSSKGDFRFKVEKLDYMDLWLDDDRMELRMRFGKEAFMLMRLPGVQSDVFNSIIKVVESDEEVEVDPFEGVGEPSLCSCCQERESRVKVSTAEHPVARILQDCYDNELAVKVNSGGENVGGSYFDMIENMRLEEGIAWIQGNGLLDLNLAIIHGMHLCRETLDEKSYTKIKVFNSYGQESFSLAVDDRASFARWKALLDSAWYYEVR